MFVSLLILHVVVAIGLILIVLLQAGRGAELGAAFGGMGQTTYGRGQYTFVHKLTTAMAVVFMMTSLSLAFISTERPRTSVLSGSGVTPPVTAPPSEALPEAPVVPAVPILPQQDAPAAGGSQRAQ